MSFSSDVVEESSTSFHRVQSQMKFEDRLIRLGVLVRIRPFDNKRLGIHIGPLLSLNLKNETKEIREHEQLLSNTVTIDEFVDYDNFIDSRDLNLYRPVAFGLQLSISYKVDTYLIDLRFQRSEDIVNFVNIAAVKTDISLAVHKDLWTKSR